MVQYMSDFFEIHIFLLLQMKIYSIGIHRLGLKCDTRITPVRTSVLDQCCLGLVFEENFKSRFVPTYNLILEPKRNLQA
jgi:hypothetical protein